MNDELIVTKSIVFNAPASKVWQVMTDPAMTKQYMYGCEARSSWVPGTLLEWVGVHEGKEMVFVTGVVLKFEPGKLLQYTTNDPNANSPGSELVVTMKLSEDNGTTTMTTTQGDFSKGADSERRYKETLDGWDYIINGMKKLL